MVSKVVAEKVSQLAQADGHVADRRLGRSVEIFRSHGCICDCNGRNEEAYAFDCILGRRYHVPIYRYAEDNEQAVQEMLAFYGLG